MPAHVRVHPILALQRTMGNRAVQRLLRSRTVQATLRVSQPGDIYEQEADRLAYQVMRMPSAAVQRTCAACSAGGALCPKCQEEKIEPIQRKVADSQETTTVRDNFVEGLGPGQPLDPATRAFFEPRFGHDFGNVRIHTDASAAQSARSIDARAYTVGRDIVFGERQYVPHSTDSQRLLAHELAHTLQQQSGVSVQRNGEEEKKCPRTFSKAGSFKDLIDLVREAEKKLSACGQTDVETRIHTLRGIYYGTKWSADFAKEASEVRNLGFQTYTASTTPDDPRPCLDCGLFAALQASQDVKDPKGHVDFGHLIIGLDARRSYIARNIEIPSQGGTGLAISTWIGDLGGGAAMLSLRRVAKPTTPAVNVFTGTDFGGSINLEGDVAGYVVARDKSVTTEPSAPVIPAGKGIADALDDYLQPAAASTEWTGRCSSFLTMVGGTLDPKGALTNRAALIKDLGQKIEQFACWYLVNRLRQTGKLTLKTLRAASEHVAGASQEVSEVFVDALVYCQTHPADKLKARGSGPAPSAPGSISSVCEGFIKTIELMQKAEELKKKGEGVLEDIEKESDEIVKEAKKRLEDLL